jgi:hypothetical protein
MLSLDHESGFNTFYQVITPKTKQTPKNIPLNDLISEIKDEPLIELRKSNWIDSWKICGPNFAKILWDMHKDYNLEPQFPFPAYIKQAEKMINEFGPNQAKFLLLKFEELSNPIYPFSFKYIIKWSNEYLQNTSK